MFQSFWQFELILGSKLYTIRLELHICVFSCLYFVVTTQNTYQHLHRRPPTHHVFHVVMWSFVKGKDNHNICTCAPLRVSLTKQFKKTNFQTPCSSYKILMQFSIDVHIPVYQNIQTNLGKLHWFPFS